MPEKLLLDIRNIHKSFGMNAVLKGISLKLGEGEVLALIGGNGAGKSTLMKIIMGIYHQDSGEIYVRGEKVTSNKTSAALARYLPGTAGAIAFPKYDGRREYRYWI